MFSNGLEKEELNVLPYPSSFSLLIKHGIFNLTRGDLLLYSNIETP